MKNSYFRIILFLVNCVAIRAMAGTETHGGGGFSCAQGTVLVDLFEATVPGELSENGLKIVRSNDEMILQLQGALDKLEQSFSPQFRAEIDVYLQEIKTVSKLVPEGAELMAPDDVDGELMPKSCKLVGIASYNDAKERLLLDQGFYSKMPKTDQAALWMHEAIYKFLRDVANAKDSRLARKIVGYVFSNSSPVEIKRAFPSNIDFSLDPFSKNKAWALTAKAEISTTYFVRVTSACQGLVKFSSNFGKNGEFSFTSNIYQKMNIDFLSTHRGAASLGVQQSRDPKCAPMFEVFDQFLRPVGQVSIPLASDDILVTEKWVLKFILTSSDWDFLAND